MTSEDDIWDEAHGENPGLTASTYKAMMDKVRSERLVRRSGRALTISELFEKT